MRKELLIGCGQRLNKQLYKDNHKEWTNLVTLDINPEHKPDIVYDLTQLPYPFEDNTFDEIHAYDVLEHTGNQGDYKFFFAQWSEFWRILKPDGIFFGKSPSWRSKWAWGDPSHTRIISSDSLVFLIQSEYTKQVGNSAMSDFRYIYKADFQDEYIKEDENDFFYVMKAVKPSRIEYKNTNTTE
jgi:SAM-dependent methyltransferase